MEVTPSNGDLAAERLSPNELNQISNGFSTGVCMGSPGPKRILLIGEDFALLRRRAVGLQRTGAQVVLSHAAELQTHVGKETFDLVILCYALSDVDRRASIEAAHRRWPRVKVLQIFSRKHDMRSIGTELDDHVPDHSDDIVRHATTLLFRVG